MRTLNRAFDRELNCIEGVRSELRGSGYNGLNVKWS